MGILVPLFSHISLLVRKYIYKHIKIDGRMCTNILQRDSSIYNSVTQKPESEIQISDR